jgi:hypothetical protein
MADSTRKLSGGPYRKGQGRRSPSPKPRRDPRLQVMALANKPAAWTQRFPINAAIREVMAQENLSVAETAELLHASIETVYAWNRTRPPKAPEMALALLCCKLGRPQHPLLRR